MMENVKHHLPDGRLAMRFIGIAAGVAISLALGACSSGTSTARTADSRAAAQVEAIAYAQQSNAMEPARLAGAWRLNDEFEHDCYVTLAADSIDAVHHKAVPTGQCSGLMSDIGAWFISRDGQEIRLYDRKGRVTAQLFRSSDQAYKGPFTLTDQQIVTATLRQVQG